MIDKLTNYNLTYHKITLDILLILKYSTKECCIATFTDLRTSSNSYFKFSLNIYFETNIKQYIVTYNKKIPPSSTIIKY